jgi:hypothetical protein
LGEGKKYVIQIFSYQFSGLSFAVFMAFVVGLITYPDGFGKYIAGKYTFRETLSDLISNCTMVMYNETSSGCSFDILNRWTPNNPYSSSPLPTLVGYLVVNVSQIGKFGDFFRNLLISKVGTSLGKVNNLMKVALYNEIINKSRFL